MEASVSLPLNQMSECLWINVANLCIQSFIKSFSTCENSHFFFVYRLAKITISFLYNFLTHAHINWSRLIRSKLIPSKIVLVFFPTRTVTLGATTEAFYLCDRHEIKMKWKLCREFSKIHLKKFETELEKLKYKALNESAIKQIAKQMYRNKMKIKGKKNNMKK